MNCSTCDAEINEKKDSYAWFFLETIHKGKNSKRVTRRYCEKCMADGKCSIVAGVTHIAPPSA